METLYTIKVSVPGTGWTDTSFVFKSMTEATIFALEIERANDCATKVIVKEPRI